ncbi:hypothetical protein NMS01_003431, partial [Vibrio cholerae]|nr:hypothetical protein [Vibrio cholerae]
MFNSKQQLNQITALVSDALQTNLSKTRHKIAQKVGHKSYESLYSSLPDKDVDLKSSLHKCIERFPESYLTYITEFEYATLDRGELAVINLCATNDIQLLFKGFMFKTKDWELKKLVIKRTNLGLDDKYAFSEPVSIMNAIILPVEHAKRKRALALGREHHYGTLAQHLNPSLVFTDKNMLLSNYNFCRDLILFGSIDQFNFFCATPDIVALLNLENELLVRYIAELTYASNHEEQSLISFGYDINIFDEYKKGSRDFTGDMHTPDSVNHISHTTSLNVFMPLETESRIYINDQVFEALSHPPIDLCNHDFLSFFMSALKQEPLDYFAKNLLPLVVDEYYGELSQLYNSDAQFDKTYLPKNVESSVLYHSNWIVQILCKIYNNSNQDKEPWNVEMVIDLVCVISKNKINVDNNEVTTFLLNKINNISLFE